MSIDFDSKTTYGDDGKYIKTKVKTYEDSIYNKKGSKEITEEKIPFKSLSIIVLDSVLYGYKKYHPQSFLEECNLNMRKK